MKRDIKLLKPCVDGCCPGHDSYPNGAYNSRMSKNARARDKKKEHQHARAIYSRNLQKELNSLFEDAEK